MSFICTEELLGDEGDEFDDQNNSDDDEVALRQGTDPYVWESGFIASWTANRRAGQVAKGNFILWTEKDCEGKVIGNKRLFVDDEKRVRRPYMDNFRYQPDQYFQQRLSTKSVIRALVVLVDFSEAMKEQDFKPSRIGTVQTLLAVRQEHKKKVAPGFRIGVF